MINYEYPNRKKNRVLLTLKHEEVLEGYFNQFDDAGHEKLSQTEIINLLTRLSICSDKLDAIELMQVMDVNNDGSIDLDEFLNAMDLVVRDGVMTGGGGGTATL